MTHDDLPPDPTQIDETRFGTVEETDGGWRLRFVRRLAHPREKVWRALTEDEHLTAWFPQRIVGERVAGAALSFEFRGGEVEPFAGRMRVVEPPAVLEYAWGTDVLRFELADDGAGCVLTLLDTVAEPGTAARAAAGWHVCLDALGSALDGTAADGPGWGDVHARYVARLGAEAATIGPPAGLHLT
jgi:uncharacterized protein YndB with AHSA1/START domain